MERWTGKPPQTAVFEMPEVGMVEVVPPVYLGQRVQINIPTEKGNVPCPHFNWACHYRELALLLAEDAQTGILRQFTCSTIHCELAEYTS